MTIPVIACLRAALVAIAINAITLPAARAELLAVFEFDDALGNFTLDPQFVHPGLGSAVLSAGVGSFSDFAGNPGRALALNNFHNGNRITLQLDTAVGVIEISTVQFDLRASASGPTLWQLDINGAAVAGGATGTSFMSFMVEPGQLAAAGMLQLDIIGSAASSALGTLRLDNLRVDGRLAAVPVPPAVWLCAPALAALMRRRRGSPQPSA